MYRGYVKLWRKMFDSEIHRNHKLFVLWIWIVANAAHRKNQYLTASGEITINPGQIVTGRKRLAALLNMSEQNIRTGLDYLVKSKKITIKITNKYSIITIINWAVYQQDDFRNNYQDHQQITGKQPASGHQLTTKQEEKNVKMKEKTSDTNVSPVSSIAGNDLCPHHEIINLFHRILPELPQIKTWRETSKNNLSSRWKASKEYQSMDWWSDFFKYVSQSDFLMGRKTEFQATLMWIVKPTNFEKIINGVYENRQHSTGSKLTDQNLRAAQEFLNEFK